MCSSYMAYCVVSMKTIIIYNFLLPQEILDQVDNDGKIILLT